MHRKKVRTRKTSLAQKAHKRAQSKDPKDLSEMTEEEVDELLEYLDSFPYSGTPSNDVDYDYLYDGDEDDTGWFT